MNILAAIGIALVATPFVIGLVMFLVEVVEDGIIAGWRERDLSWVSFSLVVFSLELLVAILVTSLAVALIVELL